MDTYENDDLPKDSGGRNPLSALGLGMNQNKVNQTVSEDEETNMFSTDKESGKADQEAKKLAAALIKMEE